MCFCFADQIAPQLPRSRRVASNERERGGIAVEVAASRFSTQKPTQPVSEFVVANYSLPQKRVSRTGRFATRMRCLCAPMLALGAFLLNHERRTSAPGDRRGRSNRAWPAVLAPALRAAFRTSIIRANPLSGQWASFLFLDRFLETLGFEDRRNRSTHIAVRLES